MNDAKTRPSKHDHAHAYATKTTRQTTDWNSKANVDVEGCDKCRFNCGVRKAAVVSVYI